MSNQAEKEQLARNTLSTSAGIAACASEAKAGTDCASVAHIITPCRPSRKLEP